MIILKKVHKNADGGFDSTWSLTEDQVNYLLSYAINDLLIEGVISVETINAEASEEELKQKSQEAALASMDILDMGKAQ